MKAPLFNAVLIMTIGCQFSAYVAAFVNLQWGQVILEGVFYQLNSVTHLLLWACIALYRFSEQNKWTLPICIVGTLFAANQMVDEFLADPLRIQANELILLAAVTIYLINTYFRLQPKPNQPL